MTRVCERAGRGRIDQDRGGAAFGDLAHHQDEAMVVAVGDVADEQRQHQHRTELREAEQAEIEGAAGQLVELPADRHHQHVERQDRRDPAEPVEREGAMRGTASSVGAAVRSGGAQLRLAASPGLALPHVTRIRLPWASSVTATSLAVAMRLHIDRRGLVHLADPAIARRTTTARCRSRPSAEFAALSPPCAEQSSGVAAQRPTNCLRRGRR